MLSAVAEIAKLGWSHYNLFPPVVIIYTLRIHIHTHTFMSSFDSIASTLWLLLNTPMIPSEQSSEPTKDVPLKDFSASVAGTGRAGAHDVCICCV